MAPVENLMQQFCAIVVFAGEQHRAGMNIVLGRARYLLATGLQEHLTQLARRKTRADDRAVQVRAEFPEFRALPRRPGEQLFQLARDLTRWEQHLAAERAGPCRAREGSG